MTNKILFCIFLVVVSVGQFIIVHKWAIAGNEPLQDYAIKLEINLEKPIYALGESVTLNIRIANTGDSPITLPNTPNVYAGYLNIWIARRGDEFRRYNSQSWGIREMPGIILKPDQPHQTKATLLWNGRPQILNPHSDIIPTDFAFPDAGVYFIKAVVTIPDRKSADDRTRIESQPIQITVSEPFGEDLEVWNQIKDSGEIASFIQRGSFLTSNDEEEAKLVKNVRQLVERYPNSFLSNQMKQKLAGFHTMREKRKALLEKHGTKPVN
ncbi:MAG TPA: hypothetical protein DEA22_05235 [Blastocatellia bacterium]|nr:hypothetical protein [Blastocatellia bacterium]